MLPGKFSQKNCIMALKPKGKRYKKYRREVRVAPEKDPMVSKKNTKNKLKLLYFSEAMLLYVKSKNN